MAELQYRCLRNKRPSKPYEFIGLGAMDVTKPYRFILFGDIHGPKPYKFVGLRWAMISQTPVSPYLRGIPTWFVGQEVVWRPGVPKPNDQRPHLLQKSLVFRLCRRRRQGQKTTLFSKKCGCLALVPQASEKHLAKKQFRDPADP